MKEILDYIMLILFILFLIWLINGYHYTKNRDRAEKESKGIDNEGV